MADNLLDELIDRVAEAVVRKIEEKDKVDAIANAVLQRLEAASSTSRQRPKASRKRSTKKRRAKTDRT